MRTMSMAELCLSTKRSALWPLGLLLLLVGGCSHESHELTGSKCNLTHVDILQAIADNSEIRGYAKYHFDDPEPMFLWELMPPKVEACGVTNGVVKIVRSSSPDFNGQDDFIAIDKMYFDNDAAFVELGFPPSGKNADVFLRKKSGKWVVIEKRMWES